MAGESGATTTATRGVPWRSPTVQVVLASTLLAPLGVPLIAPALPIVRDHFGITDAGASLLVSTYFLTGIVLSPAIGTLADRVGRRPVLVGSLLGFGLLGGAIALAPTFPVVLALRIVQGTAAAGIFVTTVTIVGDAFAGVQRNAVLGMNNAVLSAGAAAFPLVGGVLASRSWSTPFVAYLAAVPLALVAWRLLPEPRDAAIDLDSAADGGAPRESSDAPRAPDAGAGADADAAPDADATADAAAGTDAAAPADAEPGYLRSVLVALSRPETAAYYAAAFGTELLLFGAVFTSLPFLLTASFALSPVRIGLVITAAEVSSVVVSAANGRLARVLSNARLVQAGFVAYGVGLVAAWAAPTPDAVTAAVVVVGAGLGLSMPSVDAALSDLVPAVYRAGALSVRNSTTFLGRATGPVLFAGVALRTGYRPLLLAAGVVALAGAAVAVLVGAVLDVGGST